MTIPHDFDKRFHTLTVSIDGFRLDFSLDIQ